MIILRLMSYIKWRKLNVFGTFRISALHPEYWIRYIGTIFALRSYNDVHFHLQLALMDLFLG